MPFDDFTPEDLAEAQKRAAAGVEQNLKDLRDAVVRGNITDMEAATNRLMYDAEDEEILRRSTPLPGWHSGEETS